MENSLHQHFSEMRTNLVNRRKEFFNVSLEDIKAAVFDVAGNDVDFNETASAQHYHETKVIRKQQAAEVMLAKNEVKHLDLPKSSNLQHEIKPSYRAGG